MIVEPVRTIERDDAVERSARVSCSTGEFSLWLRAPGEVIDVTDHASAFLCVTLPLAMKVEEDLTVRGPVSSMLAARIPELQAIYHAWNPELPIVDVKCELSGELSVPRGVRSVSFFSRGVDSMYTATRAATDALVFGDGLDPRLDSEVRSEEIRRAREAAQVLDRRLIVLASNVRLVTDQFGTDWEDVLGAGLSFLAHGIAGGCSSVIVPSSDSYESVEPCGSSPLLDPLFSTERMTISHDSIAHSRLGKVRWLVEHHPELLPFLKVCFAQNRPDNCGECGKCLHTMVCLHLAQGLELSTEFPPAVDVDRLRDLRAPHLKAMLDWAEIARELPRTGTDGELRRAIVDLLRRSTVSAQYRALPGGRWVRRRFTRDNRANLMLSLLLEGRPYPLLEEDGVDVPPLKLVELSGARPMYGVGPQRRAGDMRELGTLVARPLPGAIPVWLAKNGELRTRGMSPPRPPARLLRFRRMQWWAGTVADDEAVEPIGYLHQREAPGRVPLYLGWHTHGHQLLGTSRDEVLARGASSAALLGYLEPPASR